MKITKETINKLGSSKLAKFLVLPIMFTIVMSGMWLTGGSPAKAEETYLAKSPASQMALDTFEKETLIKRCELTKQLATDKLVDDQNGVKFEDIDRNSLAAKRDMNCAF